MKAGLAAVWFQNHKLIDPQFERETLADRREAQHNLVLLTQFHHDAFHSGKDAVARANSHAY